MATDRDSSPAPPHDFRAPDPYAVLGIEPDAPPEAIKRAYFTLVRTHPPERDPDRFKEIRAAYERLNQPDRRLETDLLRVQSFPEPELPAVAPLDFRVHEEDVLAAARGCTELGRTDWREHLREVRL